MNYTNYIINGNFIDINSIISKKKYFKHITISIAIPIACVGVLTMIGILPLTFVLDRAKEGELKYLKAVRRYRKNKAFMAYLETLSDNKDQRNYVKKIYS
jgi:hypothetical protein